jgi:hypothetical protein
MTIALSPRATTEGKASSPALSVSHADAAVVEDARERAPALEAVVDGLGQRFLED